MPFLQGCMAFLASQAGYQEANSRYSGQYNDYKLEQEKAEQPAKAYADWLKEQPLTNNEVKLFRIYGVITPQEAKDIKERQAMEKREGK